MNLCARICSIAVITAAGIAFSSSNASALPPENGISYQGRLAQNGLPVDGTRDLRFRLYDDAVAGNLVGTVELFDLVVTEGLFSVNLDFGVTPWVTNEQLWLEVEAGPADGMQNYEIISRMKLSAVPYALNTRGISVDSSGKVGIGTDIPARLLHLDDGFTLAGSSISQNTDLLITSEDAGLTLVSDQSGSVGSFIDLMEQTGTGTLVDNWSIIRRTPAAGSSLEFRHGPNFGAFNNNLVMSMNPIGSVDIGGGPATDSRLEISNIGSTDGVKMLGFGEGDISGFYFVSGFAPAGNANFMSLSAAPESTMTWTAGGTVGIGTDSPNSRLDVRFANGNGIEVTDTNTATSAIGIHSTVGAGTGVRGESTNGSGSTIGVYGQVASPSGWGVYSNGRLGASGTKSFMIDHPLDPMGSYLLHYSSESPEPQNRYNGNVHLDKSGRGVVVLPDYFESINADHRYTLTPIGAPAPYLYIESEIQGNAFVIAGGVAGQKISWEVISRRNDEFVRQRGAPIEVQKVGIERGKLLVPSLFGQPESMGIHYKAPASVE